MIDQVLSGEELDRAMGQTCPHGLRLGSCAKRECAAQRARLIGPPSEEEIAMSAEQLLARVAEKPGTDAELLEALYFLAQSRPHGRVELIPGPVPTKPPIVARLELGSLELLGSADTVSAALYSLWRQLREELRG